MAQSKSRMAKSDIEDQGFYTGWLTEPFFQRHFHSTWTQRVAKMLAFVLFAVVCFSPVWVGSLTEGASGATAAEKVEPTSSPTAYCVLDDGTPCDKAHERRWKQRHYSRGRFGHDGFSWQQFSNPKRAKVMTIRKLRRVLERARASGKLPASMNSATPRSLIRDLARGDDDDCVSDNSYNPYAGGFSLCHYNGGEGGNTKEGVEKMGAVVLCSGGVFLSWWTGGTTGVVAFNSGVCAFGAWSLFN